jgi:hypothetical protein
MIRELEYSKVRFFVSGTQKIIIMNARTLRPACSTKSSKIASVKVFFENRA